MHRSRNLGKVRIAEIQFITIIIRNGPQQYLINYILLVLQFLMDVPASRIMLGLCFKLCIGAIILGDLADVICAQEDTLFLSKHRQSIESYILKGYGKRSDYHCDVLHASSIKDGLDGRAQFIMGLNEVDRFDLSSNLASSHCLLVSVEVNNSESLAAGVKFGWTVVQHKRVALVMKMVSDVTLNEAMNVTKLPFLVAAELKGGKEQFLCPVVGEREPHLQNTMCVDNYTSYKNKVIRFSITGVPPYLYGN